MHRSLTAGDYAFLTELERYDAFVTLFHSQKPEDARTLSELYASRDPFIPLILLQYLEEVPERRAIAAILGLIESPNSIVARAAMEAYQRNHYPGKARQLKELIISKVDRACRFAVRTLTRAGFMEVLPLILRELNERQPDVRLEMLDGLRYIPSRRSITFMLPLTEALDPEVRRMATLVLSSVHARTGGVPIELFIKMSRDESEKVRTAALEALQAFPSKKVAEIFLAQAVDAAVPLADRERAVRSLARFPRSTWVAPLVRLSAKTEASSLRLATEIALRGFPPAFLKEGLLPLIKDADPEVRIQAAILTAQLIGEYRSAQEAVLGLWDRSPEMDRVGMVEVLRELGGAEPRRRLLEAAGGMPLLGAAAAGSLSRMRLEDGGKTVMDLLSSASVPEATKQAFLGNWARRGPDDSLREPLLPWLLEALRSPRINMRYLSMRTLAWYPLSSFFGQILRLMANEFEPETVRTASALIVKNLGRDPLPLLNAVRAHPDRARLIGHTIRILTSQSWGAESAAGVLTALREAPLSLLDENPETYFAICIHMLRDGTLDFESVLSLLVTERLRSLFLRELASFLQSRERDFPPLPVDRLLGLLASSEPADRALLYRILGQDRRPVCAEAVAGLLSGEQDPACLAEGAASMRRIVLGRAA